MEACGIKKGNEERVWRRKILKESRDTVYKVRESILFVERIPDKRLAKRLQSARLDRPRTRVKDAEGRERLYKFEN